MLTPIRPLTPEKNAVRELLAVDGSLLLGIKKDAIRRLRRLIYEGVRAIPQQPGLEFGGLCIASKPTAPVLTDTVADFLPVEIQYQYGPRFRACPADRVIFERAMATHQAGGGARVVGCFRSHLAVDLQIRKEDRWLMNVLLGERGGFFMLIQPMFDEVSVFSFGPGGNPMDTLPVARFSLRDGGPEVEKPKITEPLLAAANPPFASGPAASAKATSIAAPRKGISAVPGSIRSPAPRPTGTAITLKTLPDSTKNIWLVSLGLLSLALAIFIIFARTPSAASPTGLAISRKGSTVEITWNVSSPAVKRAIRGTLFTTDDLNSSQVNLTAEEVHRGHYEYPQVTGDLFCEITFYQPNQTFVGETKTIRLKAAAGSLPAPASPAPRRPPAPASVNASPLKPAPDYDVDSLPDSDPDSGETFVVKNDRAPFVPPPANEIARAPLIARPPDVQGSPAPVTALPPVLMALKPPPPAVPPPARTAAPVTQSVTFTAAVPVKRVAPVVPSGARSLLHEPVVVTVVVDVDARGKVIAARSSGANMGIRKLLVPNSVQAAKLWQFEPALRNGAPVASQTELSFRFATP